MGKKEFIKTTSLVFIFLAIVAVATFFTQRKKLSRPMPTGGPQPQAMPDPISIGFQTVDISDESAQLEVSLSPEDRPASLSAFALKATVSLVDPGSLSFETNGELKPDNVMAEIGWTFPIARASVTSGGGILVELAGYHSGSQTFVVTEGMILATIPIVSLPSDSQLSVEIDNTVTEFFANDVITKIPFSSNTLP